MMGIRENCDVVTASIKAAGSYELSKRMHDSEESTFTVSFSSLKLF
jgi:hypothetical protein